MSERVFTDMFGARVGISEGNTQLVLVDSENSGDEPKATAAPEPRPRPLRPRTQEEIRRLTPGQLRDFLLKGDDVLTMEQKDYWLRRKNDTKRGGTNA